VFLESVKSDADALDTVFSDDDFFTAGSTNLSPSTIRDSTGSNNATDDEIIG
jgi:hypothetical protein